MLTAKHFEHAGTPTQALASSLVAEEATAMAPSLFGEEQELREAEAKYLKGLVSKTLMHKLLRVVPEIQQHHMGSAEFPTLAGSHLRLTNPALEFVKAVCAILELDTSVAAEVNILRKNLLRLIHVKEFSPEAGFQNPALSLVLPDVICLPVQRRNQSVMKYSETFATLQSLLSFSNPTEP